MPSQDEQMKLQGKVPEVISEIPFVEREAKQAEFRAHLASLEKQIHDIAKPRHVTATKALRVSIDAATKEAQALAESIARDNGGREVALAITKLQEAKMWAGKALEAYGHKLPEEYRDEAK